MLDKPSKKIYNEASSRRGVKWKSWWRMIRGQDLRL